MRLALLAAACLMGAAAVAFAQPVTPRNVPPLQNVPVATGAAGEGLYVASVERMNMSGETLVAAVTVPRGTYQVIARVVLANDRGSDGAVACKLALNGAEFDYASVSVGPRARQSITLVGVANAPANGIVASRVELRCQGTGNIAVTARWARIQALAVSRVTGT